MAASPGTVLGPEAERQQTAEEQRRILAQRQREREENDAAWLRYLDSLEPEIRAEQEAKRNPCNGVLFPVADPCFAVATPIRNGIAALAVSNYGTLNTADYLAWGV